jgi:hypothetical protein
MNEEREEREEIEFNLFSKIDESMGEKRSHQIAGGILIIGLILFFIMWN